MNDLTADEPRPLRRLRPGWAWSTVGDIAASIDYGYTATAKDSADGPRFLRITDIKTDGVNWTKVPGCDITPADVQRCRLRRDDLLFARIGSVGKSHLIRDCPEAVFASYLIRVRLAGALDPRFVFAFFQSSEYWSQISEVQQGIGRPVVNGTKLASLRVPIAPFAEQGRIADRIDELFTDLAAGVAALERVKRNLLRYRVAVLHAAVTGRLTESWRAQHGPPAEPGAKLLERILVERRREWERRTLVKYGKHGKQPPNGWRDRYPAPLKPVTSADGVPLVALPMTWCWATHDQVGDVQLGRQRAPQHHSGQHMRPYLRVANVFEDRIDTSDVLEMNFTPEEFETYKLQHGDILLNEGQSVELLGRPAMYRGELPGGCFQNTLVRQRALKGLLPDYALIVCRAQFRSGRFRKIACITTSIAHLGAQRFAALEFPLPPLVEQTAIADAVNEKLSQIDALEVEVDRGLARARRLRQAILKAAFEGKLVPQDPDDEPASVLLDRIRNEAALAKADGAKGTPGKKRGRPVRAISEPVGSSATSTLRARKATRQ